jgi:nucleotide-binding universal stress UspA family protein
MAFTHMLVPTDFSEPATHAFRYAIEEATVHQAKVTLLHVLPPRSGTDVYYVSGSPEPPRQESLDPAVGGRLGAQSAAQPTVVRSDPNEEALTRLRDLVPDSFRGTWDVEVADGQPADTIVRFARERRVDLIVMGTHGRGGLQHMLLGSVAEKVVRLAGCPVLTVRYRGAAPQEGPA